MGSTKSKLIVLSLAFTILFPIFRSADFVALSRLESDLNAAQHWAVVSGRITDFHSDNQSLKGVSLLPKVSYSYSVNGKNYDGSQTVFLDFPLLSVNGGALNVDQRQTDEIAKRFPVGKITTIYYNPEKNEQSYVDVNTDFASLKYMCWAALTYFGIVGLTGLSYFVYKSKSTMR
jgi:hypothetical protein